MWKRRVFSYFVVIILIFSLCGGFVPKTVEAAYDTNTIKAKIDNIYQNIYPQGSKFTGSFGGGIQCMGFANKVFNLVFGYTPYVKMDCSTWSGVNKVGNSGTSAASIRSLMEQAMPGDFIEIQNKHSMIFYSSDANGITVYDSNWIASLTNGMHYMTWNQCANLGRSFYLFRATNYPEKTGKNPVGFIDSVSDAVYAVNVRGWAFDEDNTSQSIPVHVYIGGPAGTSGVEGYAISANKSRTDVNNVFGISGNHGYEATLATNKTGTQPVYIYAINIGTGANTLIGYKTVNISSDTEKPKISDVQITNVSSTRYTITCTVNDNKGVTRVRFPTWHNTKKGEDAIWVEGTINGNKASCTINVLDFGNKKGIYYTHIYAYDAVGNYRSYGTVSVNIDAKEINEHEPLDLGDEFSGYIMIKNWSKVVSVGDTDPNVISKSDTGSSKQRWTFKRNDDETYTIISKSDGKCLDVVGGSGVSKSNVGVYEANGSDAQKWYIYRSDNGQYWLRSKCSETCVLDLAGNIQDEGANIQIHTFNASDAQSFVIVDEKKISERETVDIGDDFYATISSVWNGKVLTVGATKVNVVSRTKAEGSEQYWKFERNEDGYYTIISQSNGKCLEVESAMDVENQNVRTYESNNTNAQKWYIYEAGGGAYYLRPECSENRVVTLSDYVSAEGVNVLIRNLVSTTAQRFYINKCSHTFDEGKIEENSSCEEAGTKIYTCMECGATKKETVEPEGHKFSDWNITEAATCTEEGIKSRTCLACGKIETEVISNSGHHYIVEGVKPTCTSNAINVYTCGNCGDSYTETVKATGHKYEDTIIKPSAEESGYTLHECSVCGYSYKSDYTDPTGHQYSLIETEEAKCTVDGYNKYKCNDCNNAYTVVIPAVGHSYEEKITKPTCTEKGYTLHTCAECGENYKDAYVNEAGHDYTSEITYEATCTSDGLITYICKDCTEKKTAILPATGHIYETTEVTPTCETDGYALHKCKICGLSYKDTYVDKLEHSYEEIETKQPTCLATGTKEYKCEYCEDSYSQVLSKLEHNYVSEEQRQADCISDGLIQYTCVGCGDSYSVTELSHGHKYTETIVEPTLNDEGYTVYTCTECSNSYKDNYVEALEKPTSNPTDKPSGDSGETTGNSSSENPKDAQSEETSKSDDKNSIKNSDAKKIKSPKTKIKSLKKLKKSIKVSWKKVKGVKGYQIQYSTSKKFKKAKKITIKKAKKTSKIIKKLKTKKRYYVRIRTYKIVKGKKYYSDWSKKKSQKTK